MPDSLRHKPLPVGALQGQPVAPGIAIGPAFFFEKRKNDVAPLCIAEADREAEVERYEKAVRCSKRCCVTGQQGYFREKSL